MATRSEMFASAVIHFQAGRWQAAEQICQGILAADPDEADALHLLGVIAAQMGRQEDAAERISRAIALKGTEAAFHSSLGAVFKDLGRLDEAILCCRCAVELKPEYAAAHYNLGNALLAHGKLDEGADSFRRAVELKPNLIEAHNNLGTALLALGKLDEAAECCRRALALNPDDVVAHYNEGAILRAQGKMDEATAWFRRAVVLKPDFPETYYSLGNLLQSKGRLDEAVDAYRRAVELNPTYVLALIKLGTALQAQGSLDEGMACFRRVLALKPDSAEAHSNLGTALHDQGKTEEAIAAYRRALEMKPDYAEAGCNLLLALQYQAGADPAEVSAAHADYDRQHAAPLRSVWQPHENDRDAERRLRVGFVSSDFGLHPVGFFLIRAMENLDRDQVETVCYCDRTNKDEMTRRFEAAATIWREVSPWSDQQLAEAIRADRIDILFDLAGHSPGNRLLVFARKPAPIQITWAGYVGTTGLGAMDYVLADRYEIPAGAEDQYRERVLRMPDGYVCYDPPAYAPLVAPLPALKQGFVRFGSFNKRVKISSGAAQVWARILKRVPQSRLVLKHRGMNFPSVADGLLEEFASYGIDPQRVECLGWSFHEALLAEYGRIDLALDPFPYNGGLTTCEALWMGVPVITCPGETFASRHSLSHLSNAGLMETITRNLDEYVELAVTLANDLPRLAALRVGLRERMAASPLCDGKRFAANLMRILRDVWRQWCSKA